MPLANNQQYNIAMGEGGKYVRISDSTFPTISPLHKYGQFAALTYEVNPFLNGEVPLTVSLSGIKVLNDDGDLVNIGASPEGELWVASKGHVLSANSTNVPLSANEVFLGESHDILDTAIIIVTVYSDQESAIDGLKIEWSTDNINWDGSDDFTIPAGKQKTFSFQPVSQYMRVRYINGSVNQTDFRLQTIGKHQNSKPSSHRISDSIISDDDAELVKAVIAAKKDRDGFVTIGATNNNNIRVSVQEYGDTPSIDAFARLRISEPYTIFDSKQLHDKQPLFWSELLSGSATSTHNSHNACTELRTTALSSDYVIRQTKQRFNYQPGKSQLTFITFYSPQSEGVTTRVGLFDGLSASPITPKDGIFFEADGDVSWNICKNGTITESVPQSAWNVDPLDGTGASGITLNLSAAQIAIIDYQWLGVGRVRTGFVIDGLPYYVHYFNHSNNPTFKSVYMSTPNLPIRYDIQTDGTNAGSLDHICSTVISEGGIEETGVLRSVDAGTSYINANSSGTSYLILAIRLKDNYKGVTVIPEFFSMLCGTSDNIRWSLHLNPTIAGTLNWTSVQNSSIEFAKGAGATNTVTAEGVKIDSGYLNGAAQGGAQDRKFSTSLRMGSDLLNSRDVIALVATPITSNTNILGSLTFRELL